MDTTQAELALRYTDWEVLLSAPDGKSFPIMVDDEPTRAVKVHSEDKEDEDEDRNLVVVVQIGEQFFRRKGWAQVGSHCYGEYTPSWESELTEVTPRQVTLTVYE